MIPTLDRGKFWMIKEILLWIVLMALLAFAAHSYLQEAQMLQVLVEHADYLHTLVKEPPE